MDLAEMLASAKEEGIKEGMKNAIDELVAECERFKNQYKTFYFQDLVDISQKIKVKYENK
ncbi:MAG: hypothetical protein MJZ34_13390 [Paludibacteraceae bacterium]|nr:hypothetical protein [Paludibacteraceae bacterium]